MTEQHGPYHRGGEITSSGCSVGVLPISNKDGVRIGQLIDAGENASELELLRTIAAALGVRWGHDELGWWATTTLQPQ